MLNSPAPLDRPVHHEPSATPSDRERLLMAVDRRSAPVGFVSQGTDVLVVVFGELHADGGGEAVQKQHGEEASPLLSRVDQLEHLGEELRRAAVSQRL